MRRFWNTLFGEPSVRVPSWFRLLQMMEEKGGNDEPQEGKKGVMGGAGLDNEGPPMVR